MMPFVSAIIPVRNGANYLAEAIVSCLQQTAPAGEIIVVDDGSTDDTAKIAESFGDQVICLHQTWSGAAAALNAGIRRSRGEYLAFLDHDDLWDREKTARQIARMQARGELEAVFGQVEQFISPELTSALEGRVQIPTAPQPGISVSAMLIRRTAWERIGPFAGGKDALAFPAWYPRATEMKLVIEVLPDVVFKRRIHTSNYSRTQRDQLHDQLLNLMRRKIDRTRRKTSPQ
jgi:glycosyltransferase involved in cell wall biosynthesis